jgi:toxin ParE1/3/4
VAELRYRASATRDLRRIFSWLDDRNPPAAESIVTAIGRQIESLRTLPAIGSPRDEIRPGIRVLVEAPYLILYRFDTGLDRVTVLRIVHARRDLKRVARSL